MLKRLLLLLRAPTLCVRRLNALRAPVGKLSRQFATNSSPDIDLITLRRTPKGAALRELPELSLLTDYEPPAAAPLTFERVKKALKYKSEPNFEFVVKYFYEMAQFLKFVTSSYDNKIRSFDQFTTTEFLNALYIFKDMYAQGKVSRNMDSARFSDMFERLLAIVAKYPEFHATLTPLFLNRAKMLASTIDFFRSGAYRFVGELSCLSNELDFSVVSLAEVCRAIDTTTKEFDEILRESDGESFYTDSFWSCFIQVHRYKRLRSILEKFNVKPITVARVLADPSLGATVECLSNPGRDLHEAGFSCNRNTPYINYLMAASPKSEAPELGTFSSFVTLCCSTLSLPLTDDFTRSTSRWILKALMPQFCNGIVKDHEFSSIFYILPQHQEFIFDDSYQVNYELNKIMHGNLYPGDLELQVTRHLLGENFGQIGRDDFPNAIKRAYDENPEFQSVIEMTYTEALLGEYLLFCPWNLSIYDRLLDDANLRAKIDKAYDLRFEAIEKQTEITEPIDLRNITYNEEGRPGADFRGFQAELRDFRRLFLKGFPLAKTTPESLYQALHDEINSSTTSEHPRIMALSPLFEKMSLADVAGLDRLCDLGVKSTYLQIPEKSDIYDFVPELSAFKNEVLGGNNYSGYSKENLLELYTTWLHKKYPESKRHLRLRSSLVNLLNYNGGHTFVLDSVIRSQQVFSQVEKTIVKKREYIQIPDELELHKFTSELKLLRDDLLKVSSFSSVTPDEALEALDAGTIENSTGWDDHQFNLKRLQGRLKRLFAINGGCVAILDTLLHSQSVFDKIEKRIADQSKEVEYKQVPDDFLLEDYIVDLMQLRSEIGGAFKEVSASTILAKLTDMATMERKYNLEKRVIWRKLYRALSMLFKHNGQQTFILDNIILSGEVFGQFEGRRRATNVSDIVARHYQMTKNYSDLLKEFCVLWNPSLKEFENVLAKFLSAGSKYEQPLLNYLTSELSWFNLKVKNYPDFLIRLVSRPVGSLIEAQKMFDEHLSAVSKLRELNAVDEFDDNGAKIISADIDTDPKLNKYDLREFIGSDSTKTKYSNVDELMSTVTRSRSETDSFSEQIFGEPTVEAAKETARARLAENDPDEAASLRDTSADDIRKGYNHKISMANVEQFLEQAKDKQHMAGEQEFRARKAYEWSRSKLHSNRTLESGNFFEPLDPHQDASNKEYLVLTEEGHRVRSNDNPLGSHHSPEEPYTVMSRFYGQDLEKFMRQVDKLQRQHWKLVGGGEKGEKLMVFVREARGRKRKWLRRFKTVLATAGAIFVVLFGLDWWTTSLTPVSKEKEITASAPVTREAIEARSVAHDESAPVHTAPLEPKTAEQIVAHDKARWNSSGGRRLWRSWLWSTKD